jgi:hypothetical protein
MSVVIYMAEIKLYKNGELVFTKTGKEDKGIFIFDNIMYDSMNCLLIKEDNSFKYTLDFKNSTSEITLKENDYKLNLKLRVTNMKLDKSTHNIYYNIESEKLIKNNIIITF